LVIITAKYKCNQFGYNQVGQKQTNNALNKHTIGLLHIIHASRKPTFQYYNPSTWCHCQSQKSLLSAQWDCDVCDCVRNRLRPASFFIRKTTKSVLNKAPVNTSGRPRAGHCVCFGGRVRREFVVGVLSVLSRPRAWLTGPATMYTRIRVNIDSRTATMRDGRLHIYSRCSCSPAVVSYEIEWCSLLVVLDWNILAKRENRTSNALSVLSKNEQFFELASKNKDRKCVLSGTALQATDRHNWTHALYVDSLTHIGCT